MSTDVKKPSAVVALVQNAAGHILAVSRKGSLTDLGLPGGCYQVKLDDRDLPQAAEPNTWVGWVTPERLLAPENLFHEYNLGLFQHLGLI